MNLDVTEEALKYVDCKNVNQNREQRPTYIKVGVRFRVLK